METSSVDISLVDPRDFRERDLYQVQSIIQDIFAETSHECLFCHKCKTALGKKKIFRQIPPELYRKTVEHILDNYPQIDRLKCSNCHSPELTIMHPIDRGIHETRRRIHGVLEIKSIIARDVQRNIIGYGEVYADTWENAYNYELSSHYNSISSDEMRYRVARLIGHDPSPVIVLPFIGISPMYRTH